MQRLSAHLNSSSSHVLLAAVGGERKGNGRRSDRREKEGRKKARNREGVGESKRGMGGKEREEGGREGEGRKREGDQGRGEKEECVGERGGGGRGKGEGIGQLLLASMNHLQVHISLIVFRSHLQ